MDYLSYLRFLADEARARGRAYRRIGDIPEVRRCFARARLADKIRTALEGT